MKTESPTSLDSWNLSANEATGHLRCRNVNKRKIQRHPRDADITEVTKHNATDDGIVNFRSYRKILRSRLGK